METRVTVGIGTPAPSSGQAPLWGPPGSAGASGCGGPGTRPAGPLALRQQRGGGRGRCLRVPFGGHRAWPANRRSRKTSDNAAEQHARTPALPPPVETIRHHANTHTLGGAADGRRGPQSAAAARLPGRGAQTTTVFLDLRAPAGFKRRWTPFWNAFFCSKYGSIIL